MQAAVVRHLVHTGWSIRRVSDTARREAGKDIEAQRAGTVLWVSVKGYPEGTARTTPNTQARHWFAGALFDIVLWREESPEARLAVALPQRPTYENLAARTTWLKRAAPFAYLWVAEEAVHEQ